MTTSYHFSETAYTKIILHAAKYPHMAVNGVLLAEKGTKNSVRIVDAVPLFHHTSIYLAPMTEIALTQIDSLAENRNLVIAGYYAASEDIYDTVVERSPGTKLADRIQDNFNAACFVVVDNEQLTLQHDRPAIKVYSSTNGESGRWTKVDYTLSQKATTLEAVSTLLKRDCQKDVIDFDNYLDNPENDFTNGILNKDLKQLMAMY